MNTPIAAGTILRRRRGQRPTRRPTPRPRRYDGGEEQHGSGPAWVPAAAGHRRARRAQQVARSAPACPDRLRRRSGRRGGLRFAPRADPPGDIRRSGRAPVSALQGCGCRPARRRALAATEVWDARSRARWAADGNRPEPRAPNPQGWQQGARTPAPGPTWSG